MVQNLSAIIFSSNICFLPRFVRLRFLLFSGILGVIPRLKMALLFSLQLYAPSKLMMPPLIFIPVAFTVFKRSAFAGFNSTDSFLLAGALTNGAITLQFLSQKATILSPL